MEEIKMTPLGLLSSPLRFYSWSWAAYILGRGFNFAGHLSIWKFAAKNGNIFLLILIDGGKKSLFLEPHSHKFSMLKHGQIRKSKYRDLILVRRKITIKDVHQPSWWQVLSCWGVVMSDSQQSSCQSGCLKHMVSREKTFPKRKEIRYMMWSK